MIIVSERNLDDGDSYGAEQLLDACPGGFSPGTSYEDNGTAVQYD